MPRLEGHKAIVTGAGSGIGAATARMMVAEGAQVAVADIDGDAGRAVAESIGDSATFVRLDVTDEANWETACDEATAALGGFTALVNSAGASTPASIEEASLEQWHQLMSINADGTFLGCRTAVRRMKRSGGGSIVNIASTVGAQPGAWLAAYSASKAAVLATTRSTALHCGEQRYGIRCNAVLPGATHTEMFERYLAAAEDRDTAYEQFASVHPLGRIGRPEDVAWAIIYLTSKEAEFVTGVSLPVDGGFLA